MFAWYASLLPATQFSEIYSLIFMSQLFSPASVIFAGVGVLLSVCILNNLAWAVVTHGSIRQPKHINQSLNLAISGELILTKCRK